jgi:hypothetical protein
MTIRFSRYARSQNKSGCAFCGGGNALIKEQMTLSLVVWVVDCFGS